MTAFRYSTGLRDKMNGNARATIHAKIAANTISFDNASGEIRDSGNGLITAGFLVADKVYAFGTSLNNTTFVPSSVAAGVMVVTPAPATEAAGTIFALAAANGGSLKDIFRNCVIYGYSGVQPATADAAVGTATLLVKYTLDGGAFSHGASTNGLNFDDSDAGVIQFPDSTETAKGTGLVAGTLNWLRICANPADNGLASTTLPRIDMSVGSTSSADAVGATTIEVGKYYYLNTSSITFPYQYGV